MAKWAISGDITLNYSFEVEADTEEEAEEAARDHIYNNYLTMSPDGQEAFVNDICKTTN